MLMPSIFNDNLFDNFFDFPFYDDRAERQAEKKLYGHHAANLMKTDIKEKKDGYDLEMDLPGFKKDEVKVELNNGYLTVSAAKGLDEDDKDKETGKYIRRERYTVPARGASMLAMILPKRISRASSSMVS